MKNRLIAWAAIATMTCLGIFITLTNMSSDVVLQPTNEPLQIADFMKASLTAPDMQLAWYAVDAVFVVAYVVVFFGLYKASRPEASLMAKFGLAAIIVAAGLDVIENGYFNTLALAAKGSIDLGDPQVLLFNVLHYAREISSLMAMFFLGLALPKTTSKQRWLSGLLFIAAGGAIVALAIPVAAPLLSLPRLGVLIMVAVYFWNLKNDV